MSFNIEKGTVEFWINPNRVQFSDENIHPLCNLSDEKGSIFILKDSDNRLKAFYVYLGKGRTDVEWDVSGLSPNDKHMVALTWSTESKELKLYVDGELRDSAEIK